VKYELNQCDLDMILFLYSEDYFSRDKFADYNQLLSWDIKRFQNLKSDGWIHLFRQRMGKRKAIYQLSNKSKELVRSIYRKLSGEEIPVSQSQNKMFAKNVSYTDKRYRDMIIEMNEAIKQQRHRAPE
jgi:hypothetical protein